MARNYYLNLTLEEAQTHFDQFVARRPARLAALVEAYRADGGGANDLDGSPDSLVPLWRWAMRSFKVYGPDRPELTEDSASLIQDIAYYFSDVILHSIPGIQLELCRSQIPRYADQNQPVLVGFKTCPINPLRTVRVSAYRTVDGKGGERELLENYQLRLRDSPSCE